MKRAARNTETAGVEAALRRAAKKAREIAKATNTPLVIVEKGQVVRKYIGRAKSKVVGR